MEASRRGIIAALALAPVTVSMPALAGSSDFARIHADFVTAYTQLNEAPDWVSEDEDERLQQAFMDNFHRMNDAFPTTQREFIQMFHALWVDGGVPNQPVIDAMLGHAARLLKEGGV